MPHHGGGGGGGKKKKKKGNGRKRPEGGVEAEGSGEVANARWGDCSPALRMEAENVLSCLRELERLENPGPGHLANTLAKKHKGSPLALHVAGYVQAKLGEMDRALEHLVAAKVLAPMCLDIAYSIASTHADMERFELVVEECNRALSIENPTDPALHAIGDHYKLQETVPYRVFAAKERLQALLARASDTKAAEIQRNTIKPKSYASALADRKEDSKLEAEFLHFLKSFKVDYKPDPFYVGELKSMVYLKNKTLCVILGLLRRAVKRVILDENLEKQWEKISYDPPELHIEGLPPPGNILPLIDFLAQPHNKIVETIRVHDPKGELVACTTDLGRRLFLGFLMCVINEHKKGHSWCGEFTIHDLIVKYSSSFEISKIPSANASPHAMSEDMKQLADILQKHIRTSEGYLPGYFGTLYSDMRNCIGELSSFNSVKTIEFYKYLSSHLALKSAMTRGHLFLDLYRVHQAIGKSARKDLLFLLKAMSPEEDWIGLTRKHPLLKKVSEYGVVEDKTEASGSETQDDGSDDNTEEMMTRTSYSPHLSHLLMFIRHVTEHGPDHTKDDDKEQKLKSLVELDLIIAKYIPNSALYLIKALVMNDQLKEMC
uniref:Uncharacterized protein n=1 Tax=Leersia perrieri TaxID=77586 RepID=A0A0D9VB98_9ORYZ